MQLIRLFLVVVLTGLYLVPANAKTIPKSKPQITLSFAPIVKKTAPAVVNVYSTKITRQRRMSLFENDPFFRRFFGEDGFLGGRPSKRKQKSLGSGVIVEGDGYIITNNHVIKDGDDINVVLADKREYKAKVLLADQRTDLAILKIDTRGKTLPSIKLGDSDRLETGDLVLAIGNPFGVGQTVTSGIVSALARSHVGVSRYQFFIQTDAPINPGNSGGALINMAGELIGINTAIYSRSGGSNGIGFAIPVNMVKSVIRSARAGNRVVRPWTGARVQEVTADIAATVGMESPHGAILVWLHKDSPLKAAGLKRGDIIVELDNRPIASAQEFNYRFATKVIGKQLAVTFLRRNKRYKASVSLIEPPETIPRNETTIRTKGPFSGLVVANISPAVAVDLGLQLDNRGVVVTGFNGGLARRAGFKKGDVVFEVNDVPIANVKTLIRVVGESDGWWDIHLRRRGRIIRMRFGG